MDAKFFHTPAEFREWLQENHATAKEVWVGFSKKNASKKGITYPEAVDEALCYGWIDSLLRRIDDESHTIRFTPRKPKGNWSGGSIKRVLELEKLGRMQPAGMKAFRERNVG